MLKNLRIHEPEMKSTEKYSLKKGVDWTGLNFYFTPLQPPTPLKILSTSLLSGHIIIIFGSWQIIRSILDALTSFNIKIEERRSMV